MSNPLTLDTDETYLVDCLLDRWDATAQARRYARVTAIAFANWLAAQTPPATIETATREHCRTWRDERLALPTVKAVTVAKNVSELRALYAALTDTIHKPPRDRDYGPWGYVRMPKHPDAVRTYVATPAAVKTVLATFDRSGIGRRNATMIALMFYSGLRCCELARANLDDVDLEARTIHLPLTKSLRQRRPRISDETMPLLRDYLRARGTGPGPLFVNAGPRRQTDRMRVEAIQLVVRRAATVAGIPKLSPHSLRRGFAVDYKANGGQDSDLMILAGWKSPAMIVRYLGETVEDTANAGYDRVAASRRNKDRPLRAV